MTQEAGKSKQEKKWDKIYSTKEWAKLKWELGQIFSQWISVAENGAIEGNAAIHRMAQYAFEYAQQREQPAPTPESQWPTEEEIEKAYTDWRDGCVKSNKTRHRTEAWKAAIQWLQTSGVREGTREGELRECLEKLVRLKEVKDKWAGLLIPPEERDQAQFEMEQYRIAKPIAWAKAKSLLSKTI